MDSAQYRAGIVLFNRGEFFDAHEVMEDVWRAAPQAERKFLQGLIQIAVAFHHYSTGNLVGARSLLERGTRNLTGYAPDFGGLELPAFLHSLGGWGNALANHTTPPPLPQLELRDE